MKHITEEPLTSLQELAETPLWSAYLERNSAEKQQRFLDADISDFLAAMKASGEHLQTTRHQTALGMNDKELAAINIPATLILHHTAYTDYLHPVTNSRAATTLIKNSSFKFAPHLPEILEETLPFIRQHYPK